MFAAEQKANGFKDTEISQHKTVDGDHGRIETRTCTVFHDVKWLQDRHQWPGLKSVVMVESEREMLATAKEPAKIERETRCYLHWSGSPTCSRQPSGATGWSRTAFIGYWI